MKNIDYLIVGDGYAALFFAHQLLLNNKSFLLFSNNKKSASRISAGIINPVVLKRFSTFWLAQEQISSLQKTFEEIQLYTHQNYLLPETIHRIFHNENEKEIWLKRAKLPEFSEFLNPNFKKIDVVNNQFLSGEVLQSFRLDVQKFFNDFFKYLKFNHYLMEEKFDYNQLDIPSSSYQNIQFKNIVFAEGIEVANNPFFSNLPILPSKGHHLVIQLSVPIEFKQTIKKKHFLFRLNENTYYYGGTYDKEELGNEINEESKQELINGFKEFYPHKFEILEINLGFRPTVEDRRPILGQHSKYKNFYVFNGLGARGILNGNYFSKNLFDFIENKIPLLSEIDLKRFKKNP